MSVCGGADCIGCQIRQEWLVLHGIEVSDDAYLTGTQVFNAAFSGRQCSAVIHS